MPGVTFSGCVSQGADILGNIMTTSPHEADAGDLRPAAVPSSASTDDAPVDPPADEAAPKSYVPEVREDPLERRDVLLHRRVAKVRPERIEIGPPRSAVVVPLIGLGLTALLLAAIVTWTESLPFWMLPVMLLVAVVLLPMSGLTLVFAVFGANVVADRDGNNVSFKQQFLGLGVGTNELVPFWKIREFVVEDIARAQRHADGDEPALDIAQWQIALVKKSGKRLELASYNVSRSREEEGLDVVWDVAEALAAMSRGSGGALPSRRSRRPRCPDCVRPKARLSRLNSSEGPRAAAAVAARRALCQLSLGKLPGST